MELLNSASKQLKTLATNLPEDVYNFMSKQVNIVSERLNGENLFEVVKATLDKLVILLEKERDRSYEFESNN
jgi:hypothetical protein